MRLSAVLCRVPVIRFRKGGVGSPAAAAPSSGGGAPPSAAAAPVASAQSAARMSTTAIPDIDLPARYRRTPLSEEEIAYINSGGIVDPPPKKKK